MGFAQSKKYRSLSPGLRAKIVTTERAYRPHSRRPVSNWIVRTMRHCNGGRTIDAGLWLKEFCKKGGRIFLTMSGAGSSFEMGIAICELIRAGKIAAISVTGANLEESLYRLLAHSFYAYIPEYESLTRRHEKEFDRKGLRRITDTFLPEEESVRFVLKHFETFWREDQKAGRRRLWHEYFFLLFERELVKPDPKASLEDCWLYQAWKHKIPVFVPGFEDSTMGNIFAYYTYNGKHPFLATYKQKKPISYDIVLPSVCYMHKLAEWYMDNTKRRGLAFLQLGGGIAADFSICVVPHLKKDFLANVSLKIQEKMVRSWAGFIEIHDATMSFGSYSGAGGKEKITWSKLEIWAYMMQICSDYTLAFPLLTALVLGK
jgi:deoxyhypusine synthase